MGDVTFTRNEDGTVHALMDSNWGYDFPDGLGGPGNYYFCPDGNWGSGCHSLSDGEFVFGDTEYDIPGDWFNPDDAVSVHVQDIYGAQHIVETGVWPGPFDSGGGGDPVPISDWSNVVQLTAGTAPTLPPVLNLTGVIDGNNWHLSWDKFTDATAYQVQSKHEPAGAWQDLSTVDATSDARQNFLQDFTSDDYVEFDPYSFRVRALGPA